jgi:type II secretory pathway pseudopilin PulG
VEVLIALVVIGVIAAITVPNIVQSTQKKELETGFKKQYSALKQAIAKIKQEDYQDFNMYSYSINFKERLASQYIQLKNCGQSYATSTGGCILWNDDRTFTHYKTLNGKTLNNSYFDDGGFVSNDGTTFFIEQGGQAWATGFLVTIDINGYLKGPNRMGKDLFMFQITSDGNVLPMGDKNTYWYSSRNSLCSKTSTSPLNGCTCAYFAVTDKDYFKKF